MIYRLAAAAMALWLCCPSSARAEGGGASLQTLQALINDICTALSPPQILASCPQLPTVTQAVLYVSAAENAAPEMIRSQNSVPPGAAVTAGNAPQAPPTTASPLDLSTLTPLAFISAQSKKGQATATQLYDSSANAYFYAVATPSQQPDTARFVYEDLLQTQGQQDQQGQQGQGASTALPLSARISLPLTLFNMNILNMANGVNPESLAVTTLQVSARCTGTASPCVTTATATGNFLPSSGVTADKLNLTVSASFRSSPISQTPHLIIEVDVPLVVTVPTDTAYFSGLNPFVFDVFTQSEFGFTPANPSLLGSGVSIGLAPYPAPTCPGNTDCSAAPPATTFGFCASLPGPGAALRRAIGAFVAIAASGETLVSAPLPGGLGSQSVTCP
jgi:hypothetical protein